MNTNGNLYTIIYSTIIVVLVAAILAYTSLALQPKQDANVKAEAISQMLTAAKYYDKTTLEQMGNDKILAEYVKDIDKALVINGEGQVIDSLDKANSEIYTESQLKAQKNLMKANNKNAMRLPVFIFNKDGKKITVIPCYGAGLWGPIWGYLAFSDDMKTFVGAYFDHASETPGLGAKIKDDPSFRKEFEGKTADFTATKIFSIVKGGAPAGQTNAIDAITGATMTSKGLSAAIEQWLEFYKPYFTAAKPAQQAAVDSCINAAADSMAVAADSAAVTK